MYHCHLQDDVQNPYNIDRILPCAFLQRQSHNLSPAPILEICTTCDKTGSHGFALVCIFWLLRRVPIVFIATNINKFTCITCFTDRKYSDQSYLFTNEKYCLLLLCNESNQEVCPDIIHIGYQDAQVVWHSVFGIHILWYMLVPMFPVSLFIHQVLVDGVITLTWRQRQVALMTSPKFLKL